MKTKLTKLVVSIALRIVASLPSRASSPAQVLHSTLPAHPWNGIFRDGRWLGASQFL